jgi:hypothetical protein
MSTFDIDIHPDHAAVEIDGRFRVTIRRNAPPPMDSAQLVLRVYPITDGETWCQPYQEFFVDEASVIELENEMKE